MDVSGKQALIQEICKKQGLTGIVLAEYEKRLAKLSETELLALLSGGAVKDLDKGLIVEKGNKKVKNVRESDDTQNSKYPEEYVQKAAIQEIRSNLEEAFTVYTSQHLGAISGYHDDQKDVYDKLKSSNVKKVLDYQNLGVNLLEKASEKRLTRREYFEENAQHVKNMLLARMEVLKTNSGISYLDQFRGKYSKEEFKKIVEEYVDHMLSVAKMEDIKSLQQKFAGMGIVEETESLAEFSKSAKQLYENNSKTQNLKDSVNVNLPISKIPLEWDSAEPMSFEEVYRYERGCKYSKGLTEELIQKKAELQSVASAYNKYAQYSAFSEELLSDDGNSLARSEKLMNGISEYYAMSEDNGVSELKKLIEKSQLPISITNGQLDLSAYTTEELKQKGLNKLIKYINQTHKKRLDKFLGGRSIEDYQKSYEELNSSVLGPENAKLLSEAMVNDNMGVIQRYTGGTSMVGMGLTVVGGILCFTPLAPLGGGMVTVGNTLAIGGMVSESALGYTDAYTKRDGKVYSEEVNELTKNLTMNAAGFVVGYGASKAGLKAFNKLIDDKLANTFKTAIGEGNRIQALKTVISNPEYLKNFITAGGAKISSDFLISYVGDLAMMGILDTNDDWKSLLKANLIGIVVGTSSDVKDLSGVGKISTGANVKIKPDETPKISTPHTMPATENKTQVPSSNKGSALNEAEETVAPFAEHLTKTPDIKDLTNPEVKKVKLENGEFDNDGNFVSDGTHYETETGNPLVKGQLYIEYPDGKQKIAQNYDELVAQIASLNGKNNLPKYEKLKLKTLLENHSEINIKDISEIIADYCHATNANLKGQLSSFIYGYDGLDNIKDLKTFKTNMKEFNNFITELKADEANSYIVEKMQGMRLEFFSKNMATIKPEDFKKNLELYKSLSEDLQQGLIYYDFDIIFKSKSEEIIERIKYINDFDKFILEQGGNQNDLSIGNNIKRWINMSAEDFEQTKKNIELAKEMIANDYKNNSFIDYLIESEKGDIRDLCAKLKTELGEDFDYAYVNKLHRYNETEFQAVITMIKSFPNEIKNISNWELDKLIAPYLNLDENGKKNFLNKIAIAGKLPQIAINRDNSFNVDLFKKYLTEMDIQNTDKILEIVNLADPQFLGKINFRTYNSTPIIDFEQIFKPENLDNMLECVKLHKELPQEFLDYLHSDKSIISHGNWSGDEKYNYQYNISPEVLASRINIINKFKDKFLPNILEKIYNGMAEGKESTFEALSQINPEFADKLISYGINEFLGYLSKETLEKFTEYVKKSEINEDNIYNFCYGYTSFENFQIFEHLSAEELDAIPFKAIARSGYEASEYTIENIKKVLAMTPKNIRDAIKDNVTLGFYSDYMKFSRKSEYPFLVNGLGLSEADYSSLIASLDGFSEADLKSIGSPALIKYLDQSYDPVQFNAETLEKWKSVPQEVKSKLGENVFYILTDTKSFNLEDFNKKIQYLKDKNLFDGLQQESLYQFIRNTSSEMSKCLDDIISSPDFDKKSINYLIYNLNDIKKLENPDWDFVKELISNPKIKANEIPEILAPLNNRAETRIQQKDFARYLIDRGDLEVKDIKTLLYQLENHKRNINLNNEKVRFTKELLDNPNIDKSEIYKLIRHLDIETYTSEEKLMLNMLNSKRFSVSDIDLVVENVLNGYGEHIPEKYDIANDLVNNTNYQIEDINQIVRQLQIQDDPNSISLIRKFIKQLQDQNFNVEEIASTIGGLERNPNIVAKQIQFAYELFKKYNIDKNFIGSIIYNCISDDKTNFVRELILNSKVNNKDIPIILSEIQEQSANIQKDIVRLAVETENYGPKEIASLIRIINQNKTISPDILAGKVKDFISTGIDASLIQDICNNAKAISMFNNDVVNILKRLKENNTNVQQVVELISEGVIPVELGKKIDVLLALTQFTPEDKVILKKQGIDIDARIQTIMLAIDKKYPIVETSTQNIQDFLKHIANNRNADNVIKNADFAQFGKAGIPLQYSREDFMHNMDKIIAKGGLSENKISTTNVEIPELKLNNEDVKLTQEKIKSLASSHKQEEVEVIFENETQQGTRFLGTQGGSNTAYYTQIGDKLYYIKYPRAEKLGQSVEEVIASRLYRAAGIDAPNMKYVYDANGNIIGMAGEYVPNLSSTPKEKSHFTEGFAVDAWLANWDAPKNDNTQYRDSGVVKVDVGGSLRYRARGEMKEFSSVVNELSTLIEQNSQFLSMTKQELLNSLKHVTEMPEARITKIIEESPLDDNQLISTLLRRKEYLTIFAKKLEILDESQFANILDMVNEAKRMTSEEFKDDINIAEQLGYYRTKTGFEGLLNTTGTEKLSLKPEQQEVANKMIAEINKFTKENRISDNIDMEAETRDFLNSVLKGVPEFAAFFGKPQHHGHDYSLDVHILKVLQESLDDPLYQQLDDTSKIVLKFSTLLHDIGKRYLIDGSDTGHAEKSAEYVYSILDRFNLSKDVKDRIISVIENHHWFKDYNLKNLNPATIATLCRRPEDFMIYQIMAKADLKSVNDKFYLEKTGASTLEEADKIFAKKMAEIQPYVDKLAEKQVVITPSKFVKVPERTTSSGQILQAREFPKEKAILNGVETEFEVLNLSDMDPNTDMFKYGFNNILLKDLRLLVHMVREKINLEIFKTLTKNPMNNSAQSLSMISMADKSTYFDLKFGLVLDVDNANIAHAYYANTGSGTQKGLGNFVREMFENSEHRSFVKNKFIEYFTQKGFEISDKEYAAIAGYIRKKQYPETQIKGLKIGDKTFSKEDLIGAFTYSRDQLIEEKKMKAHGSHNEMVGMNAQVKGLVAKVSSLKECPDWLLEFARDNNLPIILVGN